MTTRTDRKAIVAAILRPYLTTKKDRTILSQYDRIAPAPDGHVRTVLSPVVTETGRLASGESFVDEHSTNLQNLSKKESYKDELYRVRDCLVARPGHMLVACDFNKAEAVVVGFESGNWDFYTKLIEGQDIHSWVAAQAYHQGNMKAVAKDERQRCKNVLFASFYRAGIPRITATINADAKCKADKLTEAQVQVIYNVIMDLLHLDAWWSAVIADLANPLTHGGTNWLGNSLGFRRLFFNPDTHKRENEAINFLPQTTVASRIDMVMNEAETTLEEPDRCELLLQVHDELMWEVDERYVDHYIPKILTLMERPWIAKGREVWLPAVASVGRRWDGFRGAKAEPLDPDNTLGRMAEYARLPAVV